MLTEDEFYEKWGKFFRKHNYQGKVQYPEEDEGDKVALMVIDDMPIEVTKDTPIDLYVQAKSLFRVSIRCLATISRLLMARLTSG